ncbi:MAG: hypothetical protein R3E79_60285 [Caldilineaceae bacterium]
MTPPTPRPPSGKSVTRQHHHPAAAAAWLPGRDKERCGRQPIGCPFREGGKRAFPEGATSVPMTPPTHRPFLEGVSRRHHHPAAAALQTFQEGETYMCGRQPIGCPFREGAPPPTAWGSLAFPEGRLPVP